MMKNCLLFCGLFLSVACSAQEVDAVEIQQVLVSVNGADTAINHIAGQFYAQPETPMEMAVNGEILKHLNSRYPAKKPAFSKLDKQTFQKYMDDFAASFREFEKDGEYAMPWNLEMNIQIEEFDAMVQLKISEWSYEGGAHGNGNFTAFVFDRETGQQLTPADFFTDLKVVNDACEMAFRVQHGLSPSDNLEEAGFEFEDNTFSINSNFYFTGRSFSVYFNSYEIAPYAVGPTEVEVGLDALEEVLKREI